MRPLRPTIRTPTHKSGTAGTATKKRESACVHCGKWHVVTDDKCWGLEKNKKFAPKSNKFVPSKKPQERLFSALQLEQVMDALRAKEKGKKKSKRKVSYSSIIDDDSSNHSSSESSSYLDFNTRNARSYAIRDAFADKKRKTKSDRANRTTALTTEVVLEINGPKGQFVAF